MVESHEASFEHAKCPGVSPTCLHLKRAEFISFSPGAVVRVCSPCLTKCEGSIHEHVTLRDSVRDLAVPISRQHTVRRRTIPPK